MSLNICFLEPLEEFSMHFEITPTLRILPPKNEKFKIKNSGSFHISAQNIDCGYLLGPPRLNWGLKGVKTI